MCLNVSDQNVQGCQLSDTHGCVKNSGIARGQILQVAGRKCNAKVVSTSKKTILAFSPLF